jgi:hypothetical protein
MLKPLPKYLESGMSEFSSEVCSEICSKFILSEDFIKNNKYNVDWNMVSFYQELSEDFIFEHKGFVNWFNIFDTKKLSMPFIKKAIFFLQESKQNIYCGRISLKQNLTEEFMEEFRYDLYWDYICQNRSIVLSDKIITKFSLHIVPHMAIISNFEKISEDFIKQHLQRFDLYSVVKKKKLSLNFIYNILPKKYYKKIPFCYLNLNDKLSWKTFL